MNIKSKALREKGERLTETFDRCYGIPDANRANVKYATYHESKQNVNRFTNSWGNQLDVD